MKNAKEWANSFRPRLAGETLFDWEVRKIENIQLDALQSAADICDEMVQNGEPCDCRDSILAEREKIK